MRRLACALLTALTLACPVPSPAGDQTNSIIQQVTKALQERDGREPTAEELVDALNRRTVGLLETGQYAEAEAVAQVALDQGERALGAEHPDTLGTQLNLAVTLVNLDKVTQALRHLRTLDGRLRGFVGLQLATTGAEQVRRGRLQAESRLQDVAYTLALAHPEGEALPLAADLMLRWKRLAGEEEALIARLARTSRDPRVTDLAGRLARARAGLSRLVHLPEPDPKAIAGALAEVERLEVDLAGLSRTFNGQRAARGLDWEAVQATLPQGSALLELRAFNPFDFKTGEFGETHWLALLIPADPGEGPPLRLFDLCPAAGLRAWLQGLRGGEDAVAAAVYQALFGPLDESIRGYPTLFIAPDGELDLLAFARLRLPDGRYWVERQGLRELRTGRDRLAPPPAREAGGMLVMGGVDYDRLPGDDPARPAASPAGEAPAPPGAGPQPGEPMPKLLLAMNRRLREERGAFGTLDHTGPEARAVGRYFWDYYGRKPQILVTTDTAEGRLKATADPPRVLHLATHGFFLDQRAGDAQRPMTLAGVALAGANQGLAGNQGPDGEDGILYALEAMDLNLEGTELVVLSACDTGKGEVDRSEGVYGLVRAFQIAGARQVLMTLWPLNDPLAQAFMEDFYRHWFGGGTQAHPAEALRATQLEWIRSEDPRRQDPKYWAPYVLVERG